MERLQAQLVALVLESPAAALERLSGLLTEGKVSPDISLYALIRALEPHVIPENLLAQLLRAWQATGTAAIPAAALALALGSARQMQAEMAAAIPRLDLVWTGPHGPPDAAARATVSTMEEMIAEAHRRVLVVGYNLTTGSDASARIVRALVSARRRGCEVRIALHDNYGNLDNLRQLWPAPLPLPKVLHWVGRPGDEMASLHAKLLVVDDRDLLVTSANLTYHGLQQNIEVGVRIRGDFAVKIDRHFAALEREGILVAQGESVT